MKSFGLTDKGKVRKDNQDSFLIERCDARDCLIVALCDGMGGAKAGGLASTLSNKAFVSYIYGKLTGRLKRIPNYSDILLAACAEANGVSYEYSQFDEAYSGMGTTIVGGVIKNSGRGYIINVGDSRAYMIQRREGLIQQITKDHSLVEELVSCGVITREQARIHPQKNVITRALGSESTVQADLFQVTMQMGDVMIFCSDGLSNIVSDEEMLLCARKNEEPENLCRELMDLALERGAGDNVTVVAVSR